MTTMVMPIEDNRLTIEWGNWKWQQRNAVRSVEQLQKYFPGLSDDIVERIMRNNETRRIQITPYYLGLIQRTKDGLSPLANDPMWRQVAPCWETARDIPYQYDGQTENWEMPGEMVTPIAQHKYDNRIIIRLANVCHGYCQFCYEALRTLEKESPKLSFQQEYWDDTLEYLRGHTAVEEVILSGGEPLMQTDELLNAVLADLRNLGRQIIIRLHTRALTFNPFRLTDDLTEILRRHKLNAIGLHVTHPKEITQEFRDAVDQLKKATAIIFANIPLLRGVNDNVEIMRSLSMTLYSLGVVPHYLYHFMPYSPGATEFRTSVRTGVDIIRALKRRISNLAVPEFVLPHHSGKHTMPLLAAEEPPPTWEQNVSGQWVVRYVNWRNEVVEYVDLPD